jgi:hypothetical protein
MTNLHDKIEDILSDANEQIKRGEAIKNLLAHVDLYPRFSLINTEFLYSVGELETIFKIRADKKQQFKDLLDVLVIAKRINSNTYYPLGGVLNNLSLPQSFISLTQYWEGNDQC